MKSKMSQGTAIPPCFIFAVRALNGERMRIMKKIDWVRKLTSRKFWLSIATFVSMMWVACGGTENTAAQVTSLIMAGAAVIGYVLGEGLADAGHIDGSGTDDGGDSEDM